MRVEPSELCFREGNGPDSGPYECSVYLFEPCSSIPPGGCTRHEICDDTNGTNGQGEDEDCDGDINCADSACFSEQACKSTCDKDNDGYLSSDCNGDDCVDDPNIEPSAVIINPGQTENTADFCSDGFDDDCDSISNCVDTDCQNAGYCVCTPEVCDDTSGPNGQEVDEDCNGFINCTDSACTQHPSCQIGGGSEPPLTNYRYAQCYEYYQVTTYYYCHSEGCVYLGERWEYLGVGCSSY